ncbi:MAG: AAA family ATPase [Lachnospiraceae bacterium]|nr:AAA family ATPase [Lachnospiraceae bacterium]
MRDPVDEALNSFLGPRNNYTEEEINRAQARKKRYGGTLLDNLEKVTGRGLAPTFDMESLNFGNDLDAFSKELEGFTEQNSKIVETTTHETVKDEEAVNAFADLKEAVTGTVFGQDEFVKKLVIAFKRPLVLAPEGDAPRNCIYITGPNCTGKHLTLNTLVKELSKRRVLKTDQIRTIDLALYPGATEEKLFLQDLYSALNSKADVIVFENFKECHTSLATRLCDLVIKGKCALNERYVSQNGQLVNVPNALASETVGALSAKDKYLVFISDKSLEKLADKFGAPFINALGDVCATKDLDDEALKKVSLKEMDTLKRVSAKQFKFNIKEDDAFINYSVTLAGKNKGLQGILDFYDDCVKALAQLKLEEDFTEEKEISLTVKDGSVSATIDGEDRKLLDALPGVYMGELESVKKEMDEIVGLKEIKEYILSLEEYYTVQKKRREAGLKAGEVSKHMIFTGNPGTGKTTIARIVSRYLKAIGILTGGQLVEVSRADLVGKYVGHTAPLTNQVLQSAIGGVLFIDEAYSLYRGKDDSFGLEAIDTLVKGIEDNRDNLIVILAGYSDEMEEFLTSNSGLKSRFPNVVNFPDYTGQELLDISVIIAKSKGYVIDEGAKTNLLTYYNAVQAVRAKDAGNGRLVRNKVEEAILNQSKRLAKETDADMSTLMSEDFDLTDVNG